jgi:hypothetical protein
MKFVSMSGEQRGDGQHEGEAVERQERPDVAGGPGGEDLIGDLHIARPRHAWGAGVPLQQDGQRVDVVAGEEDIREPDEIEGDDRIVLPPQNIAQHQHVWGAGASLGRHPHNPHAIDPVIHAESAAQAAEARSRIRTVRHQGNNVVNNSILIGKISFSFFYACV